LVKFSLATDSHYLQARSPRGIWG